MANLDKDHEIEPPEQRLESVFDGKVDWNKFGYSRWQTPYDRKFCKKLIQFFNVELGKLVDGGIHGPRFVPTTPPHFSKFAREIGVTEKRLYEWEDIYPEFKVAMDMARDMRNEVLKDNSLLGNYETKIATLFLGHYAGIKEKVDPPAPPGLSVTFVQGFDRYLEQRGEKPVAMKLPPVEEAEFTEEKLPEAKPVVSDMGSAFKKFHEGRGKTPG